MGLMVSFGNELIRFNQDGVLACVGSLSDVAEKK